MPPPSALSHAHALALSHAAVPSLCPRTPPPPHCPRCRLPRRPPSVVPTALRRLPHSQLHRRPHPYPRRAALIRVAASLSRRLPPPPTPRSPRHLRRLPPRR
ncbi:hypothetical protein PVAP13_3KG241154 [Panicum virgatum]|uniref:Uncharacterized protein n=1 Tax=Panicum virgatum TaxID=38727 RepID=A0A8T0V265_PANVG|nr:hypothetical protein PVAP13_3KG241154 [Panicum virgatum]